MDNQLKGRIRKLIVCIVLFAAIAAAGFGTKVLSLKSLADVVSISGGQVLTLAMMVLAVIAIETAVVTLLGLVTVKSRRVQSVISLVESLAKYVAFLVILCWGLMILGVDITTVVASVGVLALVVGFSAESLIADIVTGTFMLLENQYNVGDIVEVDGFRGKVTSIGIRTTCITDIGDNVKIVNNSEMKNILNRSNLSSRAVCDIAIPYETDIEALEGKLPELMGAVWKAHPEAMVSEPRYLGVQALDSSAVILRFVAEVPETEIYNTQRILNRDLWVGLRKLGIECPYPQLDIHNK